MKITLIKVDIQIKWKHYGWFKTFNENISIVVNKNIQYIYEWNQIQDFSLKEKN